MINSTNILASVDVFNPQNLFNMIHAIVSQDNCLPLLINFIIIWFKLTNGSRKLLVGIPRSNARGANNKWRSSFVNQDRVRFVYDSVVKLSLTQLLYLTYHVVAEIVKTEFIVGAVCYIRCVSILSADWLQMLKTWI